MLFRKSADIAPIDTGERNIRLITKTAEKIIEPPPGRPLFTNGAYAYLKVAEGCNHRCAFCAIPACGAYRSRPIAAIVREAEELLQRGVRELNLISGHHSLWL